jgi:hypothetical protein
VNGDIPTSQSGVAPSHLGDQGELWFAAMLPAGWVWQPPRRDLGKDGLIVIRDGTTVQHGPAVVANLTVQAKNANIRAQLANNSVNAAQTAAISAGKSAALVVGFGMAAYAGYRSGNLAYGCSGFVCSRKCL